MENNILAQNLKTETNQVKVEYTNFQVVFSSAQYMTLDSIRTYFPSSYCEKHGISIQNIKFTMTYFQI